MQEPQPLWDGLARPELALGEPSLDFGARAGRTCPPPLRSLGTWVWLGWRRLGNLAIMLATASGDTGCWPGCWSPGPVRHLPGPEARPRHHSPGATDGKPPLWLP